MLASSYSFETSQREPSYMATKEYRLFVEWAVSEPFKKKGKSISRLARELNRSRDTIHRWINHPLTPHKIREYLGKLPVTQMFQLYRNIFTGLKNG